MAQANKSLKLIILICATDLGQYYNTMKKKVFAKNQDKAHENFLHFTLFRLSHCMKPKKKVLKEFKSKNTH